MSSIVIPLTSYRLEIKAGTEMFLRGLEAFIGTKFTYIHNCEKRYRRLFIGGPTQEMDEVNGLRILEVGMTMERWRRDAVAMQEHILQYRLHLSTDVQGPDMIEVRVNLTRESPEPKIVVPDITGSIIDIEEQLLIVSVL